MKAALVTGAGCDIGRETIFLLAAKGHKVFGHWRRQGPSFDRTVLAYRNAGVDIEPVFADLSRPDECIAMCDRILATNAELAAFVNVAGGSAAYGVSKITPRNIVDTININLVSPMIITHKLVPALGEGSVVIHTSAITGFHAGWQGTDACFDAAKGGLHRFTENMARELGPKTRVNTIVLGLSYVEDNYKEWRESLKRQFPMKRIATPADYVKCVEFFIGHEYITGMCLPLDGGWYSYHTAPPFPTAVMSRAPAAPATDGLTGFGRCASE